MNVPYKSVILTKNLTSNSSFHFISFLFGKLKCATVVYPYEAYVDRELLKQTKMFVNKYTIISIYKISVAWWFKSFSRGNQVSERRRQASNGTKDQQKKRTDKLLIHK